MKRTILYALIGMPALLLAVVLALAACGGGAEHSSLVDTAAQSAQSTVPADSPAKGFNFLPSPAELSRSLSATSDTDRLRQGEDWVSTLANNKVVGDTFSPEYAGAAGRTLNDAAYALYAFKNLDDYAGTAQFKLGWDASGDTAQDVFLGLANFSQNRWDWFDLPGNWTTAIGSFAKYVDGSGNSAAAVVSLDNGQFKLDYVLAGTNTAPVVEVSTDLNANPLANVAPLVVSFNATASRSYGGTLTGFDFDWEGDGTWDVTGNPDGLGIHEFPAGNYQTKIRATDNLGQKTTAVIEFAAINPSNQSPIASFTRTPSSGDGPLLVTLDATGSHDPDGSIALYEWDFSGDGIYDESSTSPITTHTFAVAGSNGVQLRVTDNFYATATTSQSVTVNKGWHVAVVDNGTETRYRLTTCTSGTGADARACVAYQEFNLRDLRFVRAANELASSWSAYVNPAPSASDTGYSPSMDVLTTTGGPAIAFGHAAANIPIYMVVATGPSGATWDAPVLVDNVSKCGNDLSFKVINTIPCIAAYDGSKGPGVSDVLYFTAKDLNGSAWNSPLVALAPQPGIAYRSVTLGASASGVFKRPLLACSITNNLTPTGTAICGAANIDGDAWNAPVMYPGWSDDGNFAAVNGRPAYCAGSIGTADLASYYVRATAGDGSSWPSDMTTFGDGVACAALQVVDGKPFICFQDYAARKLLVMTATDADGTAWNEPYEIVHGVGERSTMLSMTLVNGKPVICFAYAQGSNFGIFSTSYY